MQSKDAAASIMNILPIMAARTALKSSGNCSLLKLLEWVVQVHDIVQGKHEVRHTA